MFSLKSHRYLNHKGTENIETNRFLLRKFQINDAYDIYKNWTSDVESARYNAWNIHENIDITKEYLLDWIKMYEKFNYYHWGIMDKGTKEIIGSVSATNIKDRKKYCEIGYTVARKLWNNGIATETVKAVICYLTDEIGFTCIRAMHDVRNKASGRVMEKVGMKYVTSKKQIFLNSKNFIMNCCIYDYKI